MKHICVMKLILYKKSCFAAKSFDKNDLRKSAAANPCCWTFHSPLSLSQTLSARQPRDKNLASTTHTPGGWNWGASADIWSRQAKVTACVYFECRCEPRVAAFSAKLSHSEISISQSLAGLISPSEFVRCGSPRLNECARPSGRDRERENELLAAGIVGARASKRECDSFSPMHI